MDCEFALAQLEDTNLVQSLYWNDVSLQQRILLSFPGVTGALEKKFQLPITNDSRYFLQNYRATFYSSISKDSCDSYRQLLQAAASGRLDVIESLTEKSTFPGSKVLKIAGKYGHGAIIEYYCNRYNIAPGDVMLKFAMIAAESAGRTELVQTLQVRIPPVDIHYSQARFAGKEGNINLMRPLPGGLETTKNEFFQGAAAAGHLEAIKFILNDVPHFVRINFGSAFRRAISNNCFEVGWYLLRAVEISSIGTSTFWSRYSLLEGIVEVAKSGYTEMMKWIRTHVSDSEQFDFEICVGAAAGGHVDVFEQFYTKSMDLKVFLRHAAENGQLEFLQIYLPKLPREQSNAGYELALKACCSEFVPLLMETKREVVKFLARGARNFFASLIEVRKLIHRDPKLEEALSCYVQMTM